MPPVSTEPRSARHARSSAPLVALIVLVAAAALAACAPAFGQNGDADVRIAGGEPFTWDPAAAGDAGSANVIAQAFEGVTAFDAESRVQPALADAWQSSADGRQLTFHLRPGITYSDGTPITAQDVVDSWLRLIDPAQPSPLSSLVADVEGAMDYVAGRVGREEVGFRAEGDHVIVELRRPATYFLSVTASPTLAVVPPSMHGQLGATLPANVVVSGAYVPSVPSSDVIRMTANPNYWAGTPPLDVVDLVTDIGNQTAVDAFESGVVDYINVSSFDASWIAYHSTLGPQLRRTDDFTISYYGFDTTAPPFDRPQVRLAFAKAVDWDRMIRASGDEPATSMVPPGIPGRDDADHTPTYEPDVAEQLLAEAGYPGGEGFPPVVLATYGVGYEETVAAQLEANLGVQVDIEVHDFQQYIGRQRGPGAPGIWTLIWSADYPHPHDFLGLLLETGSSSNDGQWSNRAYDTLIEEAAATADLAEQQRIYSEAQELLEQEAPVIPLAYGESWALSRDGLLGATEGGVGIIRLAGLAWQEGSGR